MRVLTVQVDVSDLTEAQIEDLQIAMEVQHEDFDGASILNSKVVNVDVGDEDQEH